MRRYDFWLVMATIAVLVAMGGLALGGTLWTWRAEAAQPGWSSSPSYAAYTALMNALIAPLVVVLVVLLGLCIPRRLLQREQLWAASGGMVLAAGVVWLVAGPAAAIAIFLLAAGVLQAAALMLTLSRTATLNYLKSNVIYQVGSALGHLGFIVLLVVWAAVPVSWTHLALFWAGSGMLVAGYAMCFWQGELQALAGRLRDRLKRPSERSG